MYLTSSITFIDKTQLAHVSFAGTEVLEDDQAKAHRTYMLRKAQVLGNLYKHRVKIRFKNTRHDMVETMARVWSVTEKFIIVQGNRMIPIHSVMGVELH